MSATLVTLSPESVRDVAAAVVDLLVERGLAGAPAAARVLDVEEAAQLLGRSTDWVYDHKAELGAFRFGDGPKARIGFDEHRIRDWMRSREIQQPTDTAARGGQRRGRGDRRASPGAPLIPYDDRSST